MSGDLELRNLTIAPGVIETIVALAIVEVEGVASVGAKQSPRERISTTTKKWLMPGILIYEENDQVIVEARVQVFYGYRLPEIAENVRIAVADALRTQANIDVAVVDVTIDAIQFAG